MKIVNMLMSTEIGDEPDLANFTVPNDAFINANIGMWKDQIEEDPSWRPNANEIVTGYNGLLGANTDPGDLDSFVANDWNEGVIMGFVNTMDPVKTHQVVKDIQKWFKDHEGKKGYDLVTWGFKSGDIISMPEVGVCSIESVNTSDSPTMRADCSVQGGDWTPKRPL